MSERDRAMALAMLAEGFGVKDLTPARIRLYSHALEKVPVAVLEPMVQRTIATRKPKWGDLPPVAHLLDDAEACRTEMRAALKFLPCVNCSESGWTEVLVDGVKRAARCGCWTRHQAKVQALNVGTEPLALPMIAGEDR